CLAACATPSGSGQRRLASEARSERSTRAQTATEAAVTATARSMETRTAPTTRTTAVPPPTRASAVLGVSWTVGRDGAGAGAAGAVGVAVPGVMVVGTMMAGGVVVPVGWGMVGSLGRNMGGSPYLTAVSMTGAKRL